MASPRSFENAFTTFFEHYWNRKRLLRWLVTTLYDDLTFMLRFMLISSSLSHRWQLMFPRGIAKPVPKNQNIKVKTGKKNTFAKRFICSTQTCLFIWKTRRGKARTFVNEHESVYLQFPTDGRQRVAKKASASHFFCHQWTRLGLMCRTRLHHRFSLQFFR